MNNQNFHPLDCLVADKRLFMLEAMIPFVDPNMRLPIALFIKISELELIMNGLSNQQNNPFGDIHFDPNNPEEILTSLSKLGLGDITGQMSKIKNAMNMMKMMDMMDGMTDSSYVNHNTQNPPNPGANDTESTDYVNPFPETNMYDNIMDILNDYKGDIDD